MDLYGAKTVFKLENNPWLEPIIDAYKVGISHLGDYLQSDSYEALLRKEQEAPVRLSVPPRSDRTRKAKK